METLKLADEIVDNFIRENKKMREKLLIDDIIDIYNKKYKSYKDYREMIIKREDYFKKNLIKNNEYSFTLSVYFDYILPCYLFEHIISKKGDN